MKAMNICRPLERSRGTVVTECVENILKAPSVAWKNRLKEVVQAARQDERQKMLKRFMKERKTWESSRREDLNKLQRLQEELKKKDENLSWLKSSLTKRDDLISKLEQKNAELERHLETELNARIQNAQSMRKLIGKHSALYPGLMSFGEARDMDPFHEVSMDLLRQHKIQQQAELNAMEDAMSGSCANETQNSESTFLSETDSKTSMENLANSFLN